ncbi:MAG TPA: disulfide bond formation protein B [Rhodocyclaceae bacterium]|nr:disulfide bond formation protein B [Rhodocyclaceae bacterium]
MCLQLFKAIPARAWFAACALGAFGLVVIGLQLQAIYHLAPCPLCIFQRVLYLGLGGLALLGWLFPRAGKLWSAGMVGVGITGFAVAVYQSWMQAFPHLAKECSYTDPDLIERFVEWLGMMQPSLFLATGFCTSRDWVFLGLSMADWSVLVFAGFIVVAALLFFRRKP